VLFGALDRCIVTFLKYISNKFLPRTKIPLNDNEQFNTVVNNILINQKEFHNFGFFILAVKTLFIGSESDAEIILTILTNAKDKLCNVEKQFNIKLCSFLN
jgi:hypothetical protein